MRTYARWLCASGLVGWLCLSQPAFADVRYTVNLKDGGIVSGELVELAPDVKIVLKLATGEVREIAWVDITSHEKVAEPAPPPPAKTEPPPSPGLATPEQIEEERRNQQSIDIVGDRENLKFQRVVGGSAGSASFLRHTAAFSSESWENMCAIPCRRTVNAALLYRVDGPGVTTSDEFAIPRTASGPTKLVVESGSSVLRGFAWVTATIGVSAVGIGVLSAVFLAGGSDAAYHAPVAIGGISGGALLTVLGFVGVAKSGTTVKDGSGKVLATRSPHWQDWRLVR